MAVLAPSGCVADAVARHAGWVPPGRDDDGKLREVACIAETARPRDISSWLAGMRVIVRNERQLSNCR